MRVAPIFLAVAILMPIGCTQSGTRPARATREIIVLAASSLREPVSQVAELLQTEDPTVRIRVSYAGSQELIAQILAGAPADVFLCAGTTHLTKAISAGVVDGVGKPFATNRLAIALHKGLDPPIDGIGDLGRSGLRLVMAAEEVPVGRETRKFLGALEKEMPGLPARILRNVRSFEASDMAQVAKVRLGEADAAVVYASDLKTYPELVALEIPERWNSIQIYYGAPLKRSQNLDIAREFVKSLTQKAAQTLFAEAGFRPVAATNEANEG